MPDLTAGVRAVRSLMTTTVRVDRDRAGVADDVLNETTGQLVRPNSDSATVWTGPAMVNTISVGESTVGPAEAFLPESVTRYRALLPLDAPALIPGDLLTVTASDDVQLTGRRFRVRTTPPAVTLQVARPVDLDLL